MSGQAIDKIIVNNRVPSVYIEYSGCSDPYCVVAVSNYPDGRYSWVSEKPSKSESDVVIDRDVSSNSTLYYIVISYGDPIIHDGSWEELGRTKPIKVEIK